ncbi:MAG: SPOR domain-containing protein [Spirochaetaceae bacterium]|jgi:hypothetical protein|nr:SPOR domain-containing protein [Spirochaetaceae bacterium]
MKRIAFFGFVILAALLCVSASVWEGAASVSLNGELPEEGYYVATKSFPRNTVVDVTNLETSQTIRVIVASGLDSPGLLAILSKDAAGAIGLHARFVGRIRMTMPSEPVGFSRFPDELDTSGDPDFDPAAAIAAARDSGFDVKQAADEMKKDPAAESGAPVAGDTGSSRPIAPNPAAADIVDLPESRSPAQERAREDSGGSGSVPAANTATVPGVYGYTPEPVIVSGAANTPYPAEQAPEKLEPGMTPQRPAPSAPAPLVASSSSAPAPLPPAEFSLIPAEQRPPESPYPELPPEAEIAPLRGPGEAYAGRSVLEQYVIPPIGSRPPAVAVQAEPVIEPLVPPIERAAPPVPEIITEVTIVEANPAAPEVSPFTEAPPPIEAPPRVPATVSGTGVFSVPVINSLERGKYYLQLAAYSLPELVETELSRISTVYPLAVQESGGSGKPLYRILIGPVNLGESGALLQRFKASGYRDAFVRKEG